MDFLKSLNDLGDMIAPYLTKEYVFSVIGILKVIGVIIAIIIFIKIILKLSFFRKVKLILKNLKEINEKMNSLMNIATLKEVNGKKPNKDSLIKNFIKKKRK